MANKIEQYRYPFQDLPYSFENCKIGVSIGEDQFMKLGSTADTGFRFSVNGQEIQLGRTRMYETDEYLQQLNFDMITPSSQAKTVLIQVIYNNIGS